MKAVHIMLAGSPQAKARHRTTKSGHSYNPQSKEEAAVRWDIEKQINGHVPFSGPCEVKIIAKFPRPKAHFGTGKNARKLKTSAPDHHIKKPDADNISKFYKDCMNGLVYDDDKQVVLLTVEKKYSLYPRVAIAINEI